MARHVRKEHLAEEMNSYYTSVLEESQPNTMDAVDLSPGDEFKLLDDEHETTHWKVICRTQEPHDNPKDLSRVR